MLIAAAVIKPKMAAMMATNNQAKI